MRYLCTRVLTLRAITICMLGALASAYPVEPAQAATLSRGLEGSTLGADFDVEHLFSRLRLVGRMLLAFGHHWSVGTEQSLGMDRIAGQRVTDISAAPAALTALLVSWPLATFNARDGDAPPWVWWPIHVVQLPQAYAEISGGDRIRWFAGAGLHGRLITTSALFEEEPDGFQEEQGLLFTLGPRVGIAFGRLHFLAFFGRRHWLREGQRWEDDGTELRLRCTWRSDRP